MAKVTKNINSIVTQALHGPRSKDGFVLYPKVDGYNGEMEGGTKAEQSKIYSAQAQLNFNSPTNIRKVFITGRKCAVQYYGVPRMGNGSGLHFTIRGYKGEDLIDTANKICNYRSDFNKYQMSRSIDKGAVEPDRYNLTGNGIGVITTPYVCNNIEEIYVDWTIFCGEESLPYLGDYVSEQAFRAYITGNTKFSQTVNNVMRDYFMAFNSGGVKDLRKRFPRLRIIAMISKLDDILDAGINKVDERFSDVEKANHTWYEANKELIMQSNSIVLMSVLDDIKKYNENFIIKDNQYRYDDEVLKGLVSAFLTKIKDAKRKQMYGEESAESKEADTNEPEVVVDMCEEETYLNDILQKYGDGMTKKVLLAATNGMRVDELKKLFLQFSKKNRSKFADMIHLNVD